MCSSCPSHGGTGATNPLPGPGESKGGRPTSHGGWGRFPKRAQGTSPSTRMNAIPIAVDDDVEQLLAEGLHLAGGEGDRAVGPAPRLVHRILCGAVCAHSISSCRFTWVWHGHGTVREVHYERWHCATYTPSPVKLAAAHSARTRGEGQLHWHWRAF